MNEVRSQTASLFVSNLHPHATQPIVQQIFCAFGKVLSVQLYPELPQCAIVEYSSTEEADIAIVSLHGRYIITALPLIVIYDKTSSLISDFGRSHSQRVAQSLSSSRAHSKAQGQLNEITSANQTADRISNTVYHQDMKSYHMKPVNERNELRFGTSISSAGENTEIESLSHLRKDLRSRISGISLK